MNVKAQMRKIYVKMEHALTLEGALFAIVTTDIAFPPHSNLVKVCKEILCKISEENKKKNNSTLVQRFI